MLYSCTNDVWDQQQPKQNEIIINYYKTVSALNSKTVENLVWLNKVFLVILSMSWNTYIVLNEIQLTANMATEHNVTKHKPSLANGWNLARVDKCSQ